MFLRVGLLAAGLLSVIAGARGQPVPPPFQLPGAMPRATLRAQPDLRVQLGRVRIEFERTALDDVRFSAGAGEQGHRGDAAGNIDWLCYTAHAGAMAQRVWLIAHGEMGGPDHVITEVQSAIGPFSANKAQSCPELPAGLQPLKFFKAGVAPGMPMKALRASLGKPSSVTAHGIFYAYVGKTPGHDQDQAVLFDRLNFVYATERGGRVQGLVAAQVTSY